MGGSNCHLLLMSDQEGKRQKRRLAQAWETETETENQINDELKRTDVKEAFESRRTNDI